VLLARMLRGPVCHASLTQRGRYGPLRITDQDGLAIGDDQQRAGQATLALGRARTQLAHRPMGRLSRPGGLPSVVTLQTAAARRRRSGGSGN
jgi:hypothetical protein